jgi:tetratricopeptide (TPR) repeat protein
VEGFYRRNGVDLELQCCFEPGIADWLKCARGVDVYDNLATGFYLANTAEWPMLSRNGYSLPESAVFKFAAHEIGHWLGLDHPKDRDASPGDLMVGGSYWHGRLLTPLEVRQILRPLISPTPLDKVCAELGAAIKPCPREHVGQKMHNNWRWFLQDHFAELKRITELEPENSQAWHLLGGLTTNCTDRLNFYTRAIEAATAKEDWSNVGEAKCRRAEVLFNLDQLDRALAELNEILETPKFMLDTCLKAGALTLRAYVHWNRKDFPAAERDMKERTTERPSERLESLWGWGAMKQHLEGRLRLFRADLLLEKGNRAEAIQEVKSVLLNYRPDDTEAFSRLEKLADAATVREFRYKRAYHYACVGRYDEAIADLTPMIEGGSLSAVQLRNMHYLRGVAYRRKKEFDKAIKDYNLISTDADKITLAKLYLELAEVYLEKGEPDKAVSVYGIKPARDYFPKPTSHLYRDRDPEFEQLVLLGRGKVYLALKRADEAIADLTWVIMNWGGNRREREGMGSARHEAALLARAQAWLLKNDTEKAREDLLEAVSLSSDDSSLLELLGKTGMPLHEAYLVRGLGRCGLVTSSGKRLPAFRMDKAKASLALPDLTKAIEISPDYAEAYKWRAVVRRHLGLADGAKADETKAKELAEKTTAVSNEKGAKQ